MGRRRLGPPWMLLELLLIAGIVFAINLLPAFGPPTAAVLVAVSLNQDLPSAPPIATGAIAAASGRFALANGARRFRPRLLGGAAGLNWPPPRPPCSRTEHDPA